MSKLNSFVYLCQKKQKACSSKFSQFSLTTRSTGLLRVDSMDSNDTKSLSFQQQQQQHNDNDSDDSDNSNDSSNSNGSNGSNSNSNGNRANNNSSTNNSTSNSINQRKRPLERDSRVRAAGEDKGSLLILGGLVLATNVEPPVFCGRTDLQPSLLILLSLFLKCHNLLINVPVTVQETTHLRTPSLLRL